MELHDFQAQLAQAIKAAREPVKLPVPLLDQVVGGLMAHTPFCQFRQYESFRQINA